MNDAHNGPYTTEEAAHYLGLSRRQVQHLSKTLGLGIRIGQRTLTLSDDDLVTLAARQTTRGRVPGGQS